MLDLLEQLVLWLCSRHPGPREHARRAAIPAPGRHGKVNRDLGGDLIDNGRRRVTEREGHPLQRRRRAGEQELYEPVLFAVRAFEPVDAHLAKAVETNPALFIRADVTPLPLLLLSSRRRRRRLFALLRSTGRVQMHSYRNNITQDEDLSSSLRE